MVFSFQGQEYMTDNDLEIHYLGRIPEVPIQDEKLKQEFLKEMIIDFFGGDAIISHKQSLVSRDVKFNELNEEFIKEYIEKNKSIKEAIFKKNLTGIGAGHSMGGLSMVCLGLNGTKMLDSGLTGLCMSRSLVTSGRRREVKVDDIVIPESITQRLDLLKEYIEISKDAFNESANFKDKFKKSRGIEAFNKSLGYDNPLNLKIILPLDAMATIYFEVMQDRLDPDGLFLPREMHTLADKFPQIADDNGFGIMYRQRINVPRDGYFHYHVFKNPKLSNYVSELGKEHGIPLNPKSIYSYMDLIDGLKNSLKNLEQLFEQAKKTIDPKKLHEAAMMCTLETRRIVGEYNAAVKVKILDSLSFRVNSEQKRHATLRQHVESIYSAANRAVEILKPHWEKIQTAYKGDKVDLPISEIEKAIVIDGGVKQNKDLLIPYIYHSTRQLLFYDKLKKEGVSYRDAAYKIPRCTRTFNLEDYDLINMIDLEEPLRLCGLCEIERKLTAWKKRKLMVKVFPELENLIFPKCNIGYCTEVNPFSSKTKCNLHKLIRNDYSEELHLAVKKVMADKSR